MADVDEKKEELIKIEDKSKIIIRAMKEADIAAANEVAAKAFNSTKKFATCNQYVQQAYVAEYDQKIVGMIVAVHYGSIS